MDKLFTLIYAPKLTYNRGRTFISSLTLISNSTCGLLYAIRGRCCRQNFLHKVRIRMIITSQNTGYISITQASYLAVTPPLRDVVNKVIFFTEWLNLAAPNPVRRSNTSDAMCEIVGIRFGILRSWTYAKWVWQIIYCICRSISRDKNKRYIND